MTASGLTWSVPEEGVTHTDSVGDQFLQLARDCRVLLTKHLQKFGGLGPVLFLRAGPCPMLQDLERCNIVIQFLLDHQYHLLYESLASDNWRGCCNGGGDTDLPFRLLDQQGGFCTVAVVCLDFYQLLDSVECS